MATEVGAVGVEPAGARRFFTGLSAAQVNEITGTSDAESYRFFVWVLWLLDPILAVAGYAACIAAKGWWSIPLIAVTMIAYFPLKGSASIGSKSKIGLVATAAVLALICSFFVPKNFFGIAYLISIPLSVAATCLMYRYAAGFIRMLAADSERARDFFIEHGVILMR
ncbi:hypothetical protein D3C72_1113110 [compost metagenome]